MKQRTRILTTFARALLILLLALPALAQEPAETRKPVRPTKAARRRSSTPGIALHLTPVETVTSRTEFITGFSDMACDQDGNLFLAGDSHENPSVRKLNAKGELIALFQPALNPEMKVAPMGDFAVAPDGEFYVWVGSATEITRYVLIFKPDGSYKSRIKLDPGFPWVPASIAVFSNGSVLMTGQQIMRDPSHTPMLPFTGIFSSDGRLLKRIDVDDRTMQDAMAGHGDSRVKSDVNPTGNRAIAWGHMVGATDGNIYVMRWSSPATVFAISAGGEVVRSFKVDPGDPAYMPRAIRVAANRLVVEFSDSDTMQQKIVKVTDLDGNELATYDNLGPDGKRRTDLGIFGCYTPQPEHFTFVQTSDSGQLQLQTVEGR